MFSEYISNPISPLTLNFFAKIHRPEGEPDFSLSSLAIAMLKPRIPDYSGIYGRINYRLYGDDLCQDVLAILKERQEMSQQDCLKRPCLRYYICADGQEIKAVLVDAGMKEVESIGAYVKQELALSGFALYVHKDTNYAVMISPTTDIRVYHLSIAFLHWMFPLAFEKMPPTREEVALTKTLSYQTSGRFVSAVGAALESVKKEILRYELALCFRGFRKQKIEQADYRVQQLRNQMEQYLQNYRDIMKQIEEAVIWAEGLRVVNSDDNNEQEMEAVDYISTCPNLHSVSYVNGELTFDVDTVLTNFDVLKWKNAVGTKDIYNNYRLEEGNPFASFASRKLFLDSLFGKSDPEMWVKLRGRFCLTPTRGTMSVGKHESYDGADEVLRNCLSNPHFQMHGCPGQNRDQIQECLRQADIISAVECCIAATGSVNIGETEITFRPFVQEILTSKDKIIRRYDGADMTPAEALLWLLKKEEEKQAA